MGVSFIQARLRTPGEPIAARPVDTPRAGRDREAPGAGGGVVGRNSPPFLLPAEHFTAALAFLMAGALGLVWVAPDLARGLFSLPRVAAVTHLFTLGWISTTIMGALYQFLPVALYVPIRSERLAHCSFALYVPGLALFVGGLAVASHAAMLAGAALLGVGLLLFVGNLAATLRHAPERGPTWWALAGAAVFLGVTIVLGASLTGNLRWGYLAGDRFLALGVHLHIAVVGWVLLVMVGVAHRLLPMFLLSHGASETPARLAVGLLAGGASLLLIFHHALTPWLVWTVAAMVALGLGAFLLQAWLYFRHRRKPALDPGLRLAGAALCFLCVALAIAPWFLVQGLSAPRVATAYVLALVLGGISLFVAGHYYKILPFLVWFHRFGPLVGARAVPKVADLYSAALGNLAAALLSLGAAGLIAATLVEAVGSARISAAVFASGAVILTLQMSRIGLRRPE